MHRPTHSQAKQWAGFVHCINRTKYTNVLLCLHSVLPTATTTTTTNFITLNSVEVRVNVVLVFFVQLLYKHTRYNVGLNSLLVTHDGQTESVHSSVYDCILLGRVPYSAWDAYRSLLTLLIESEKILRFEPILESLAPL